MFRLAFALLVLSLTAGLHGWADPAGGDPVKVVKELYAFAGKDKNFGFSADSVKAEKKWLTPELYAKMVKKVNQPVAKGDAPDIEGDVFLNSQEDPNKVVVGKADVNGTTAKVPVTVIIGTEKPIYTVLLEQVGGAWKVADVDYGKDGKLTDLLK